MSGSRYAISTKDVPNGRVQETDLFSKTRREYIPAGLVAASLLLMVLLNRSVSGTKPSHMAVGVAEIGTAH